MACFDGGDIHRQQPIRNYHQAHAGLPPPSESAVASVAALQAKAKAKAKARAMAQEQAEALVSSRP